MTRKNTTEDNRLRKEVAAQVAAGGALCSICRYPVTAGTRWQMDHVLPVATHPELRYERSNVAPSHATCNQSAGGRLGNARKKEQRTTQPVRDVPKVERPKFGDSK